MIDVAHFKTIMIKRLDELGHRLEDIEHELDEPMNEDSEERATEREGDEVLETLGNTGLQEIRLLAAALKRIEKGTYGECMTCGNEILSERLELVPHATQCRNCAR
ncbi:MAG: TraR/DksA family transcriptional regulator [Hyphomicrobiales bacterium]